MEQTVTKPEPKLLPERAPAGIASSLTRILLVDFRNGEPVDAHPELAELMADGWAVRSAVPRIVEGEGTRLLIVLAKPDPVSTGATLRPRVTSKYDRRRL